MRMLIATSNPGKLRDFTYAAQAYPYVTIEPVPGLSTIEPPEETADTFHGNAWIKAEAYSSLAPADIVLADDSGLEVPALANDPGVRSARYARDQHWPSSGNIDQDNLNCLLDRTAHLHTPQERHARYRCALIAVRAGDLVLQVDGELDGILLREPRGIDGFGYDPIFYLPELGLTMAELDPATRLEFSHRGRALRALLAQLIPTPRP